MELQRRQYQSHSGGGDVKQVEIGGINYRIAKLEPIKQLHIARRIAPLIAAIAAGRLNDEQAPGDAPDPKKTLSLFADITKAIRQLDDADTEYVIAGCLAACRRESTGSWAPVTASNGHMMFKDIDLPQMLSLVYETIMENLGGFLGGSGSVLTATAGVTT